MELIAPEIATKEHSDLNIAILKEDPKIVSELVNQTNIYREDVISEFEFKQRGFLSSESWSKTISLHAEVIQVTKNHVTCECLVDKENKVFETRVFARQLFDHIKNLQDKLLVLIKISTKPGSSRIDIYHGQGVVNEIMFKAKDGWDKLIKLGVGEPITFEND